MLQQRYTEQRYGGRSSIELSFEPGLVYASRTGLFVKGIETS